MIAGYPESRDNGGNFERVVIGLNKVFQFIKYNQNSLIRVERLDSEVKVANYLKEYETQVLQMSVPPTESDNDSLKNAKNGGVASSSSHRYIARYPSFNLDSISYITKDRTSKITK